MIVHLAGLVEFLCNGLFKLRASSSRRRALLPPTRVLSGSASRGLITPELLFLFRLSSAAAAASRAASSRLACSICFCLAFSAAARRAASSRAACSSRSRLASSAATAASRAAFLAFGALNLLLPGLLGSGQARGFFARGLFFPFTSGEFGGGLGVPHGLFLPGGFLDFLCLLPKIRERMGDQVVRGRELLQARQRGVVLASANSACAAVTACWARRFSSRARCHSSRAATIWAFSSAPRGILARARSRPRHG